MLVVQKILPYLLAANTILSVQAETLSTPEIKLEPKLKASLAAPYNGVPSEPIPPTETVERENKMQIGEADGGEAAYGCLGCSVTLLGTVMRVFPESDLNRFGIEPKDKILSINGHKFHPFEFQRECIGMPGTPIILDLIHKGMPEEISVQRVDSRLLSTRAKHYKKLSQKRFTW